MGDVGPPSGQEIWCMKREHILRYVLASNVRTRSLHAASNVYMHVLMEGSGGDGSSSNGCRVSG